MGYPDFLVCATGPDGLLHWLEDEKAEEADRERRNAEWVAEAYRDEAARQEAARQQQQYGGSGGGGNDGGTGPRCYGPGGTYYVPCWPDRQKPRRRLLRGFILWMAARSLCGRLGGAAPVWFRCATRRQPWRP